MQRKSSSFNEIPLIGCVTGAQPIFVWGIVRVSIVAVAIAVVLLGAWLESFEVDTNWVSIVGFLLYGAIAVALIVLLLWAIPM